MGMSAASQGGFDDDSAQRNESLFGLRTGPSGNFSEEGKKRQSADRIPRRLTGSSFTLLCHSHIYESHDTGTFELGIGSVPRSMEDSGTVRHYRDLIAVVGLRGGSMATATLSVRGLRDVIVRPSDDEFTFILGDRLYCCPSIVAEFLSPRVCGILSIDATATELMIEVTDGNEMFELLLDAARGCDVSKSKDSATWTKFICMCGALCNSELYESKPDEVTIENAVDRIRFLSTNRCDISSELEFISSHFCDFLRRSDNLVTLSFSVIYEILSHRSLQLESEDELYDFISKRAESISLLEFVRLEYCSIETICDFVETLYDHYNDLNSSVWRNIGSRLIHQVSRGTSRQFPPSMKTGLHFDVPDGIIGHFTRECGGNVHDCHVVEVTSSKPGTSNPAYAAKVVGDLRTTTCFFSTSRKKEENIPHTRNNWICYEFKKAIIIPTHYTIRSFDGGPGNWHLKSWVVETSLDGRDWQEIDYKEKCEDLNGSCSTATFPVAGAGPCRFVRLVQVGRCHQGGDGLCLSAWEIFGTIIT
jgi:hypothetical protein